MKDADVTQMGERCRFIVPFRTQDAEGFGKARIQKYRTVQAHGAQHFGQHVVIDG